MLAMKFLLSLRRRLQVTLESILKSRYLKQSQSLLLLSQEAHLRSLYLQLSKRKRNPRGFQVSQTLSTQAKCLTPLTTKSRARASSLEYLESQLGEQTATTTLAVKASSRKGSSYRKKARRLRAQSSKKSTRSLEIN